MSVANDSVPSSIPNDFREILEGIRNQFHLSPERLISITKKFVEDFMLGLGEYSHPMAMIPTFVTGVPDGTEMGTFLALDLGGTNLRVCEVQLDGKKGFTLRQQKYRLSEALKTGDASTLFDYLADSVDAFLTEMGHVISDDEALHLGLTFSFPVEQTALDKGVLLTWTKGFSAKNAVGNDVVKLLQDAFDRKHMHVKCTALVNDTVGALLSRAYTSGGCMCGAIFGTGTNGAYIEDVVNIPKLRNSPAAAAGGKMLINTEWGGFDNSRSILPTTPFDNKVDRESINPRFQAYEKFISGMYLGEIVRNLLLSLIDAVPFVLFNGYSSPVINTHYGFDASFMSEVEGASSLEDAKKVVLSRLDVKAENVTDVDVVIVRWICGLVATRAAKLSACAIAAVLIQTGYAKLGGGLLTDEERISVGVDGSLIQFYPNFEKHLRQALRAIVGDDTETRVDIGLAKDGSGVGAALCALQAAKQSNWEREEGQKQKY